MRTILVPTDFSPAAANAARYATDMARAIGASVYLLHVCNPPINYSEVPVLVDMDKMTANAEAGLREAKEKLEAGTGHVPPIEYKVLVGTFYTELVLTCEKINPFVVVMGSQGTTAAQRFFFGSHTVYTLQHLPWPVIAVPKDVSWSAIKKIGFACDLDEVVDTTPVREIKELVQTFQAALYVLNTGKKTSFDPDVVFESGLLQEMLNSLDPQYNLITGNDTDRSIMDFAEKNQVDQ
jgi:nucleotide-binding universal stress UspA family protein